jgi:hypothetical protein
LGLGFAREEAFEKIDVGLWDLRRIKLRVEKGVSMDGLEKVDQELDQLKKEIDLVEKLPRSKRKMAPLREEIASIEEILFPLK